MPKYGWRGAGALGAMACAMAFSAGTGRAQPAYPVKPVRIISGFTPGGFNNVAARLVAQKLSETLGQQVIVENRPGANGLVASEVTARAAPDGYVLFLSNAGLTTNPMLYDRGQREPIVTVKEFTAISLVANIPNALVVHPSVPATSVKELLAIARAKPNALTLASSGVGAPGHLTAEFLQQLSKAQFVHVPYKGTGPALIDLVGGQVDLSFPTIGTVVPHVQSGRLRALGVTSARRSPLLPAVPTIEEAGVPGFEVVGWHGIVGPAGMNREIVTRLSAEIGRSVRNPDVRENFLKDGAEPVGNSPEQFASFLEDDLRKWTKVIRAANIQPSRL